MLHTPSVGEPGYLPYCGQCISMVRMKRGTHAFKCPVCGLTTTRINGQEMFEQTAPRPSPGVNIIHSLDAAHRNAHGIHGSSEDHAPLVRTGNYMAQAIASERILNNLHRLAQANDMSAEDVLKHIMELGDPPHE